MKAYIIPGLGESCNLVRYKNLAQSLKKIGFDVVPINPNWYLPLSEQVFKVEKNSVIVGFSMGAVLAYLIARKYSCKHIVLASLSPIQKFKVSEEIAFLSTKMDITSAKRIVTDWKNIKIDLKNLSTPYTKILGENETDMGTAHISVPKTGHYLTTRYIKVITDVLSSQ